MTDKPNDQNAAATEDEYPIETFMAREWDGRRMDWFLQKLVSIVNDSPMQVGVTLTVGGGMVSGTLISATTYFAEFGKVFGDAMPGGGDGIEKSIRQLGEAQQGIEEDAERAPPQFIHLKDAKLFTPSGSTPSNQGVLWRGTIASINGFTLGSMS
jgi:hypothetical protein